MAENIAILWQKRVDFRKKVISASLGCRPSTQNIKNLFFNYLIFDLFKTQFGPWLSLSSRTLWGGHSEKKNTLFLMDCPASNCPLGSWKMIVNGGGRVRGWKG